ncbi:hypothetical protein EV191_109101 [Tamaricihabitans halophyticus]|uniref:Uncharacterized protein n=1 Tax=Tamaricihabitans halophyticus TaxID=1262583 RepID=A0A4R2QKC0_9PSEU|nr:hypothetical protein [Tamaricihabitans halophyticus]TCP49279.1 hypothetical protein EV191_109101 [Tamaricihabitans halophyticus]
MNRYRRVPAAESQTTPLPKPERDSGQRRQEGRASAVLRGLSGSLALGFAVLALFVLGVQVFSFTEGFEGSGANFVVGHLAAAALAIACQRMADRGSGLTRAVGILGVFAVIIGALWLLWWS